ncbi:MAG: prepilin-type N-terminal cleavage/methylation domain-containing protein [Patescibacteria group bacterium]
MQRYRQHQYRAGFTIVELLIVIVVIGVLAAIIIVAYSGVQERAYVTRINTAGRQYAKAISLYAAGQGAYPAYGNRCLGSVSDYPTENGFDSGECVRSLSNPGGPPPYRSDGIASVSLDDALKQYMPSLSAKNIKTVQFDDDDSVYRGYLYSTASDGQGGSIARVLWFLNGTKDCGSGIYTEEIDNYQETMCTLTLPSIK